MQHALHVRAISGSANSRKLKHALHRGSRPPAGPGRRAAHRPRPAPAQVRARPDAHPHGRARRSPAAVPLRPHRRHQRQRLHRLHARRILAASGLRTGLYTSPHLVRVNERIQILSRAPETADSVPTSASKTPSSPTKTSAATSKPSSTRPSASSPKAACPARPASSRPSPPWPSCISQKPKSTSPCSKSASAVVSTPPTSSSRPSPSSPTSRSTTPSGWATPSPRSRAKRPASCGQMASSSRCRNIPKPTRPSAKPPSRSTCAPSTPPRLCHTYTRSYKYAQPLSARHRRSAHRSRFTPRRPAPAAQHRARHHRRARIT